MARSNGPFGPPGARAPLRRGPGDDALATLPAASPPSWPTQGYQDQGHPSQAGQGYHFPPPEPDPNYGYNQQAYAPQQWGQQGGQPGYDLASYLPADPPPFQQTAHHQQAYAEPDADYVEEFYEDEEPRRGRRWILICVALVGAIGVGGALAYGYRSVVAPNKGRVPLVKAEPNVKVKPEQRGGREFPGADRKLPNRLGDGSQRAAPASEAQEEPPGEAANLGPRPVRTIPIGSQPAAQVPPPPQVAAVPGISLQNLPPPPAAEPETPAAAPPPQTGRVTIGEPPPASPPARKPAAAPSPPSPIVARAAPPPRVREPAPSSGLGYVAVLSSQKTRIDAVKAIADAVEKHPDVLTGRTPDVQEANLGEKGIWYRAVVGPPGSREAALNLCTRLKAEGHGCWVKEY